MSAGMFPMARASGTGEAREEANAATREAGTAEENVAFHSGWSGGPPHADQTGAATFLCT
ncbi:hypothetical protein OG870_05805 [Streptomyces sp. NBC_00461]|nr:MULTISPECIES: hypothetical protein [unclassified Streptomyces]MCX5059058.1 hypothetical protein [Streptomyces sp. NBC_00452]